MGQFFSDKTERAFDLIWMQFDKEKQQEGKRLLEEAVKEGDPEAYCFLARTYMGFQYVWQYAGFEESDEKADELLLEGISRGSRLCILIAMRCGLMNEEIKARMPYTLKEARDQVLEWAEAGHPFCQYVIGNTYYFQDYIAIDDVDVLNTFSSQEDLDTKSAQMALPWLAKAVGAGYTHCANNLYNLFSGSEGLPKNRDAQVQIIKFCVEKGNPKWEQDYGEYYDELGDYDTSFQHFLRSAQHGYLQAYYDVGYAYEHGRGVAIDMKKAAEAYEIAAKDGSNVSACLLGIMLLSGGRDITKDETTGFNWVKKAAENKHMSAYPHYGRCLLRGIGTSADPNKGFQYLQEAYAYHKENIHNNISPFSTIVMVEMFNGLGDAYMLGLGTEVNYNEAVRYYQAVSGKSDYTDAQLKKFKKSLFGGYKLRG